MQLLQKNHEFLVTLFRKRYRLAPLLLEVRSEHSSEHWRRYLKKRFAEMDGLSLDDEIHISDVIAGSEGIEGAHLF